MKHLRIVTFCMVYFLVSAAFGTGQEQEGEATWYESESYSLHASHADLPIGTRLRIVNLEKEEEEKVVYVNVTNRIQRDSVRILDLSEEAAKLLEMNETGGTRVRMEVIAGFTEEHVFEDEEEEVLVFNDEPDPYKAPEPAPSAPMAGTAVPEIAAVSAVNDQKPAEQGPPQPPARTTVPPAGQPEWIVVETADASASPPVSSQTVTEARTAAVKVIVNVDGQEHVVVVLPQLQSDDGHQAAAPPPSAPPAPPAPAVTPSRSGPAAKVIPKMPDPAGKGIYRVQVGAFSRSAFAQKAFDKLKAAGFNPAFERHNSLYRVVIPRVSAAEMSQVAQRLGAAGFAEVWIREER